MSEIAAIGTDAPPSMVTATPAPVTPLVRALGTGEALVEACGARTAAVFSDAGRELSALVTEVAAFDRGSRVRLRVTGQDRVRWLNGMVTNTVKSLTTGTHNYTFVLNSQGRIQADAAVFAYPEHLTVETDRSQAERLVAHLDHFIIMDDVELSRVEGVTSIGLAGPGAEALLSSISLPTPAPGTFAAAGQSVIEVTGEALGSSQVRRFSLWVPDEHVEQVWRQLLAAGALPAGAVAVDALRVLEGTPLYGVDIGEKTLAQETGQMRALNFSKGCYLGQEIVERVRSRANVHRGVRQFALHGEPAAPGMQLQAGGAVIGELTSVAGIDLLPDLEPDLKPGQIGLALVRVEALAGSISYPGGSAEVLAGSPLQNRTGTT
jgi:folate-binding protein YgfZ